MDGKAGHNSHRYPAPLRLFSDFIRTERDPTLPGRTKLEGKRCAVARDLNERGNLLPEPKTALPLFVFKRSSIVVT
jgi:hypothetical protein